VCIRHIQNLGNFMTDRNSSRVLAPPGGKSQISLSDGSGDQAPPPVKQHFAVPEAPMYAQIHAAAAVSQVRWRRADTGVSMLHLTRKWRISTAGAGARGGAAGKHRVWGRRRRRDQQLRAPG